MTFFVELVNSETDDITKLVKAATLGEAVSVAKGGIDALLWHSFDNDATADALFVKYRDRGAAPFIFTDTGYIPDEQVFNHLQYASFQCLSMCGK